MPSQEELDCLKEHLPYELCMLRHAYGRMLSPIPNSDRRTRLDWNMQAESFALHARNLKNFLANDAGKGNNNFVALDFVKGFKRRTPNKLSGAFQRLNQQMLHLGKQRRTETKDKFNIDDAKAILDWVDQSLKEFVAALPPELRSYWCEAVADPEASGSYGPTLSATNTVTSTGTMIGFIAPAPPPPTRK